MFFSLKDAAVAGRLLPFTAEIHSGKLMHVVGPNGAGKSTLLALLAGLQPYDGEASLMGNPLHEWRGSALAQLRAWLPQQHIPLSPMPVYHYIRLHLQSTLPQADQRLTELLDKFQLRDKLRRSLTELSGGEWQRVRVVAACAQVDPQINAQGRLLILDEPMTALDIAQQKAVDEVIKELCQAGICVIASSHDLNHSLLHADSAWLLHRGKLMAQGEPSRVLTPERLSPLYHITFRQLELEGRTLLTVMP